MVMPRALNEALKQAIGSPATISRRASKLIDEHGPMTADEARWILAHEAKIDLRSHLAPEQLNRVRELRLPMSDGGSVQISGPQRPPKKATDVAVAGSPIVSRGPNPTPASIFDCREFHKNVVRSSKRLFVGRHHSEAIRKAIQALINRVKRLSGLRDDGKSLMSKAFSTASPLLQASPLSTNSETDEHEGIRFLMMGAVAALRNPRAHEDEIEDDFVFTLEALAVASTLHRFLDRCEAYAEFVSQ